MAIIIKASELNVAELNTHALLIPLTFTLSSVKLLDAPQVPDYIVRSAYLVHDQFSRWAGWVVRASYREGKPTWFAVLNNGLISVFVYATRDEALCTLDVMFRGHMLGSEAMGRAVHSSIRSAS